MSEQQLTTYPLSQHQNEVIAYHEAKVRLASAQVTLLRKELERADAVAQTAVESRNVFLSYIIKEFGLPKTAKGWAHKELKPGEYTLVGELLELPAAEPAAAAEETDTIKTVEE